MELEIESRTSQNLLCEFCYEPHVSIKERKYLITNYKLSPDKPSQPELIKTLLWLCKGCVSQIPKHKILT